METIYLYLLKSGGLIALFYLAYYFLLRKETFFTANRYFLLSGLVTSILLPLFYITKIIWVTPNPTSYPLTALPLQQNTNEVPVEVDWYLTSILIYLLGLGLLFIKFGIDYWSLNRILYKTKPQQQADIKLIDVSEKIAPFSYFNTIVFNSSMYSPLELQSILEHEKIHSEQYHTLDVLIIRFYSILFWFNPFIWLYQRAMLQNLEFIADSEATKRLDDKKGYQMALLKITTHENCVALTNHFFQSLIKKRIVMLNKNQSKKWNSWKYLVIIPALIAFVFIFQIKVLAQEKKQLNTITKTSVTEDIILVIDKNTTDAQLKSEAQLLKVKHGITLKVSKIKRNANQEITGIKVQFDDQNGNKGTNQVDSDKPISPITFVKNVDSKGRSSIGFHTGGPIKPGKINKNITITSNKDSNNDKEEDSNFSFTFSDDFDATDEPEVSSNQKVQINKNVIVTKAINGEKPIIYVNGKKIDNEEILSSLDPLTIDNVNVLKGDISLNKYGEEGKNGVIVITTKDGKTEVNVDRIIKRAKDNLENSKVEILKSFKESEKAQPDMERAMKEIELSKIEMQKARAEIDKAKQEIEKARHELEKAKAEANKKQNK